MTTRQIAPVFDRPPYSEGVLEAMAIDALRRCPKVLPTRPGVVVIENLIEATFGFNETYEELESGVLGEIYFTTESGPLAIRVARQLGDINPQNPAIEHERRMTLSHEFGHALAHCELFARNLRREKDLRLPGFDCAQAHIVCREGDIGVGDVRPPAASAAVLWLEWEANYLMASLLLPRHLVLAHVNPWLSGTLDGFAPRILAPAHRLDAISAIAHTFDVSNTLAAWRLTSLFPAAQHPDLFERVGVSGRISPSLTPRRKKNRTGRI